MRVGQTRARHPLATPRVIRLLPHAQRPVPTDQTSPYPSTVAETHLQHALGRSPPRGRSCRHPRSCLIPPFLRRVIGPAPGVFPPP